MARPQLYLQEENRSSSKSAEDWWIGIYTNPNMRDGRVGYLPKGTPLDEIERWAYLRMKEEQEIMVDALYAEIRTGSATDAAQTILFDNRGVL